MVVFLDSWIDFFAGSWDLGLHGCERREIRNLESVGWGKGLLVDHGNKESGTVASRLVFENALGAWDDGCCLESNKGK